MNIIQHKKTKGYQSAWKIHLNEGMKYNELKFKLQENKCMNWHGPDFVVKLIQKHAMQWTFSRDIKSNGKCFGFLLRHSATKITC